MGDVPAREPKSVAERKRATSRGGARIGTDESGKGDYFGPLVIAGVFVDSATEAGLVGLGVRDSKKVSDGQAMRLAAQIQRRLPTEVVVIGPQRYNALHRTMRNVNRLLAWGHARVIENLLARVPCDRVISDQFGDAEFLERALMDKGRQVRLEQRPRAEADMAVAAASLVARAEFLRRLAALSTRYDVTLPKGATAPVSDAGRRFVERHGVDALAQVAKLHFRTTAALVGTAAR